MATTLREVRQHRSLAALLLLFLALTTLNNLSTPLFEAPDEADHFRYIDWLAGGHGLPDLDGDVAAAGHEIGQPPLYYALLSPLVALVDTSDLDQVAPPNPNWGQANSINAHFHTEAERFPYRRTALAVHLARFVSSMLSLVTISSTYFIARLVRPEAAVVAAAIVAFNPQFLFISAVLTKDTLVAALSGLTLLVLLQGLFAAEAGMRHGLLLGALWGLAALAKASGLAVGAIIALGLLVRGRRAGDWRSLTRPAAGLAVGFLVVAGWWFLRNWNLYDHPLAWSQFLNANRGLLRAETLDWFGALREATFLRQSYWAMFGYGIRAPASFYFLTDALVLTAAAGLVLALRDRKRRNAGQGQRLVIALLALWSLAVFSLLLNWIRQVEAGNQGRLLFPAISSLAVLMAFGLHRLGRRWLGGLTVAALAAWAAALPFVSIMPAFAQPKALSSMAQVPNPVEVTFGQELALLGYSLAEGSVKAGERLEITLYWQGLKPVDESYVVRVQALDSTGAVVAQSDSIPFSGRYSTLLWPPGERFADPVTLPPLDGSASAGQGHIRVSAHLIGRGDDLLGVQIDGREAGHDFAVTAYKVAPAADQEYRPERLTEATFEGKFRLKGWDAPGQIQVGEPFQVSLYWEALAPDGRDYTVFVHLLSGTGQLVAQADSPPQNNRYPTSYWAAGEIIVDPHVFQDGVLAGPGAYLLAVGLYDPITGQRLQPFRPDGRPWPEAAVSLGEITLWAADE